MFVLIPGTHTPTRLTSILCLTAYLSMGSVTQAEILVADAYDRGHYKANGLHNEALDNTFTGFETSTQHSFFAFDLSGVSGQVTGALLTLQLVSYQDPPNEHNVSLQHVSSAVTNVLAGHSAGSMEGQAVFTDLGDGANYGMGVVDYFAPFFSPPPLVVPLNQAALDAMTAVAGGDFVIGVKVTSATGPEAAGVSFSDASGSPPWNHRLDITFDPNALLDFKISDLALESGQADLTMIGLGSGHTFHVQRTSTIVDTGSWQTVHTFVSNGSDTNWVDSSSTGLVHSIYRLENEP